MRKMQIKIFAASLLLIISGLHSGYANDLQNDYSHWIDKYPSEKSASNHADLLNQPNLKKSLRNLLPQQELHTLLKYTVETPVKKVDNFLVVNRCRPHNCSAEMATIVIDMNSQKIWVGFFTRESNRVITNWYGSDEDYSALPESIKNDFLARHGD